MFNLNQSVSSKITLEVIGTDGLVNKSLVFNNIMTNYGLDSWTKGNLGSYLAIGSGSKEELATVTDLAAYVKSSIGASTSYATNFIDTPNNVMRSDLILNVVFPIETAAVNYSEMGIHDNNKDALQTYARLRDGVGAVTSVSVQVGEQVRVTYVVQFSIPLSTVSTELIADVATTITTVPNFSGSSRSVRLPATDASYIRFWAAGQAIPKVGISPTGGVVSPRAATVNNGLYKLVVNKTELNLTGGIALVKLGDSSSNISIMCHFDPPIPKIATTTMDITCTSTLTNGVFYA